MILYDLPAEPALVEAARKIKAGAVGDVRSFNYSVMNSTDKSSQWYNTAWRTVPDVSSNFAAPMTKTHFIPSTVPGRLCARWGSSQRRSASTGFAVFSQHFDPVWVCIAHSGVSSTSRLCPGGDSSRRNV
jgi:hypothetical protein